MLQENKQMNKTTFFFSKVSSFFKIFYINKKGKNQQDYCNNNSVENICRSWCSVCKVLWWVSESAGKNDNTKNTCVCACGVCESWAQLNERKTIKELWSTSRASTHHILSSCRTTGERQTRHRHVLSTWFLLWSAALLMLFTWCCFSGCLVWTDDWCTWVTAGLWMNRFI